MEDETRCHLNVLELSVSYEGEPGFILQCFSSAWKVITDDSLLLYSPVYMKGARHLDWLYLFRRGKQIWHFYILFCTPGKNSFGSLRETQFKRKQFPWMFQYKVNPPFDWRALPFITILAHLSAHLSQASTFLSPMGLMVPKEDVAPDFMKLLF